MYFGVFFYFSPNKNNDTVALCAEEKSHKSARLKWCGLMSDRWEKLHGVSQKVRYVNLSEDEEVRSNRLPFLGDVSFLCFWFIRAGHRLWAPCRSASENGDSLASSETIFFIYFYWVVRGAMTHYLYTIFIYKKTEFNWYPFESIIQWNILRHYPECFWKQTRFRMNSPHYIWVNFVLSDFTQQFAT